MGREIRTAPTVQCRGQTVKESRKSQKGAQYNLPLFSRRFTFPAAKIIPFFHSSMYVISAALLLKAPPPIGIIVSPATAISFRLLVQPMF
ncbi:hypothetical protein XELAEV_18027166mg [Xenopus laevis]|uniref:Uncharacterized protein n=1 Tax=Xenopus laevis TaxID=8355 RepID=A0A974HJF0_XENLA|nr:hypothetical protein XELAEV_18027166mg [Xenopus laevis]